MDRSRLRVHPVPVLFSFAALLILGACGGSAPDEQATATEPAADDADAGSEYDRPTTSSQPSRSTAPHRHEETQAYEEDEGDVDGMDAAAPQAMPDGMVVVPAGQQLEVALLGAVSTKESQPGDAVTADIKGGFTVDGKKVPAGKWTLHGSVVSVTPPTRKGDAPGEMEIAFDTIETEDGTEYPVVGYVTALAGETKKRNVGIIAGAAAVGAILGKEKGGDTKDAVLGAAVGAAAGAGIVRALPGKHLTLEQGAELTVTLAEEARLPYRQRES